MTELEKMTAYHSMQTIKETPEWARDATLIMLCKRDRSGQMERLVRTLAEYGLDVKKIVPCIMAIMQGMLLDIDSDDKSLYSEQTGGEVK